MAVGVASLSFTGALSRSGHGISLAHGGGSRSVQLASSASLSWPSFRAPGGGAGLWTPCCNEGQQQQGLERGGRSHRTLRAALSQSVDAYRRVGAPDLENVDVVKLVECLEEASAEGREASAVSPSWNLKLSFSFSLTPSLALFPSFTASNW